MKIFLKSEINFSVKFYDFGWKSHLYAIMFPRASLKILINNEIDWITET